MEDGLPASLLPGAGVAPDATGGNFWRDDAALADLLALRMEGRLREHLAPHFDRLGGLAAGALDQLARAIDANPPVLCPRDRFGRDDFRIDHHPAWHQAEQLLMGEFGLHAIGHRGGILGWPQPLPPVAKYAFQYLVATAEFGLLCPISMTDSLTRVLRRFASPALLQAWLPRLTSQKPGSWMTGAMFMTELAAGSDVGAIETTARLHNGAWRLSGRKWFCSNAGCDVALTLARVSAEPGTRGLGLFLLPRRLADGSPNHWRIVRLKEKLGTRGMASGEAILDGALAEPVGDLARGFVQMAEMVNLSRVSNGVRAAGLMRRAWLEARAASRGRRAFGRAVIDFPLQRRQLLKLLLAAEQALSFSIWTAALMERADDGDGEAARLLRLATPLLKFRACRDARKACGEAMEARGGNGYVEEFVEPRLLRDAHLGSIWEGTSNIVAEDAIRRAVGREHIGEPFAEALVADLAEAPLAAAAPAAEAMRRAAAFAEDVADEPALHRQAASALYRAATACLFVIEGAAIHHRRGDARRMLLSRLVLDHQLAARDPMARGDITAEAAIAEALLGEEALGLDAVLRLL
ncbi:MAG: acyl-CoA dehydrogenase family protein [Acetobacteraceae bacterium]|nr:acyl-CoA dehydrogenase family protein [Acetobacteraceae bacterium]